MISLYMHLFWSLISFLFSILYFALFLYVTSFSTSVFIDIPIFTSDCLSLPLSILIDSRSCIFSSIVLLISSCVFCYSYFYMSPYSKPSYFLWGTFLFVMSMLVVINLNSLFYLMLGWDGLGLVSFFLIVYFQNSSSISSGVFTILINRVGDCFFLLTISVFLLNSLDLSAYFLSTPSLISIILIVVTFITKSAIYPFSPWLPLAMAAPTPISSLVHSSTLVTAGLYLMIRFSAVIYSSYYVCSLLLVLCIFTSFYAGLNSLFEVDINKLIALSTLSHLGFIGLAFSTGLSDLAFFHMLTHALFNSLLFMCIGDIIVNLSHAQDIRYLSSGFCFTPFSSFTIAVSLLNLLGLPMISGFFSKDLVLETLFFTNVSYVLHVVVYLNVAFTYFYTYQLLSYSISLSLMPPFFIYHSQPVFHTLFMLFISFSSVVFGKFYISSFSVSFKFEFIPMSLKLAPIFLNLFMLCLLFMFVYFSFSLSPSYYSYLESMLFLQLFWSNCFSTFYTTFLYSLVKSSEIGLFNYLYNFNTSFFFEKGSTYSHSFSSLSPLNITFFSLFFLVLMSI